MRLQDRGTIAMNKLHIRFYGGPWDGIKEVVTIEPDEVPGRLWVPTNYNAGQICPGLEEVAKYLSENAHAHCYELSAVDSNSALTYSYNHAVVPS